MPAAVHEIEDARAEGVEFRFLVAPIRIMRTAGGVIERIELQEMRLGPADEQGRRRPLPIAGRSTEVCADTVIVAVSQAPDWDALDPIARAQMAAYHRGWQAGQQHLGGGDDRGPGIASKAIAQGRLAAESAHAELRGERRATIPGDRKPVRADVVKTDFYPEQQRTVTQRRSPDTWLADPEAEIDRTIGYEEARQEAGRCMSCGLCFDCEQCFMYCNDAAFTRVEKTSPGNYFVMALDACEGCGKCIELCPCGYLDTRGDQPIS